MFSLQVLVTLAIIAVAGVLLGMLLGHYITIKATAALTSLEARMKSALDLFHQRLATVDGKIVAPIHSVEAEWHKIETATEDAVDVIREEFHTEIPKIEKEVTTDITTIGGKIKQL